MANRGCTVSITILGGSSGNSVNEEISLPVALHSPLSVLKEQLENLTSIATVDQVLILCDLSDIERNNDKLLEGRDYMNLRDCGISNGAIMTLHALGMSAERKQKMQKEALKKPVTCEALDEPVNEEDRKHKLDTVITAARANHSYNGVVFDVMCNGPFEVDLLSVSVGGMLGRVRIYARNRQWNDDQPFSRSSSNAWSQRGESMSITGWSLVADQTCRPAWDKPLEIKFDMPVKLLPHQRRGLYCHSSLPDDLGIQYQSYQSKDSIVAENQHITLLAGLGHTGFHPFDERQGWYRAWRGLSGSVAYRTKWKGWSPSEHRLFPADLREAVRSMLLCQNRILPPNIIGGEDGVDSVSIQKQQIVIPTRCPTAGSQRSSSITTITAASAASRMKALLNIDEDEMDEQDGEGDEEEGEEEDESMSEVPVISNPHLQLHTLPKFLVYNILEYMHWDWYVEVEIMRAADKKARIQSSRADLLEAKRGSKFIATTTQLSSDDDYICEDDDDDYEEEEDGEEDDEAEYDEGEEENGMRPMEVLSNGLDDGLSDSSSSSDDNDIDSEEEESDGTLDNADQLLDEQQNEDIWRTLDADIIVAVAASANSAQEDDSTDDSS